MHAISRKVASAILVIAGLVAGAADAQEKPGDYPRKPIRIVVGIAPGGGLDAMTRLGAQKLNERWGHSVIVDNRPGGGTLIGMDIVAQAPPDGYTLLGASDTLILNGVLKRAKYDVRKAFAPIVKMTAQPYVLVVTPSLPVRTVKELVAHGREKPGALSYGSQGVGTTGHLGMERFKSMAGIDIVHVPYKGSALALIDVLSGQIQLTFASTVATAPHARAGRLRGLAVTGARRTPAYPDLPTVAEAGVPGFELTNSYSLFAPAGTPQAIIQRINEVIARGMNSPETAKVLAAEGTEAVLPATPEAFRAQFARDYAEAEKSSGR